MPQLICQDLCLGYQGQEIIRDLNFEVNKGDYLCIVGENGSGKSTLMRTLLGLQPPISGKILTGDGVTKRSIGYLPQQTVTQRDFPSTVWEIVLSGCQNRCGLRPYYTKAEKQEALSHIDRLGLSELRKRCYRELSGGQQQRVLLARALCAAQDILLLDEPTAGLDPVVTEELYRIIEELNRNDGMTILMISHDIEAALRYADKILHIADKVFFGTTEEYIASGRAGLLTKEAQSRD